MCQSLSYVRCARATSRTEHTIESVVCPYVRWIRLGVTAFSNLTPMIPTADDMLESRTTWEPKEVKVAFVEGSQILTHEVLIDTVLHGTQLIFVRIHPLNCLGCDHGMSHLFPRPYSNSSARHPRLRGFN